MDNRWKDRFEHAEVKPNPALWDKISADLDAPKKVVPLFPPFLSWAASIAVVLVSGLLVWQYSGNEGATSEMPMANHSTTSIKSDTPSTSSSILSSPEEAQHEVSTNQVARPSGSNTIARKTKSNAITHRPLLAQNAGTTPVRYGKVYSAEEEVMEMAPSMNSAATVALNEPNEKVKPTQQPEEELYPDAEDFLIDGKKDKRGKRSMWVGLAQGVGSYSSNISAPPGGFTVSRFGGGNPGFTIDAAADAIQKETNALDEQLSLSTALMVGIPITNNLSMVTGMSYNRSNFSSTAVNLNGEILHFTANPVSFESEPDLSTYEKIDLQGTYEMAVVPVLADWRILSGNFGWSLQAGPEVGFMLQQQVQDDQSGQSRSSGAGDIYRPMHLRVAAGTTVTYAVSEKLRLSFQPLIEKAVTSITTEEAPFQSLPLNYSAFVGLRYSIN